VPSGVRYRDDLDFKCAPKGAEYSSELLEGLRTLGSRNKVLSVPETLMKLVSGGIQI